jgi:hypothetical protein
MDTAINCAVVALSAIAEVDPKYIGASFHEATQGVFISVRGADSRDDLGVFTGHGCSRACSSPKAGGAVP